MKPLNPNSLTPYMERDFSWVVSAQFAVLEGKIAGCSNPGNGQKTQLVDDLDFLQQKGITGIISLNEVPPESETIRARGITHLILPVEDHYGPSIEQLETIVQFVETQKSVLIHCNAGQGRTGTCLAGYLISKGMPSAEAISLLQKTRKGSCGTNSQKNSLIAFEEHLRK